MGPSGANCTQMPKEDPGMGLSSDVDTTDAHSVPASRCTSKTVAGTGAGASNVVASSPGDSADVLLCQSLICCNVSLYISKRLLVC